MKADFYTEVYNIVREIPEGCVVTYGQLAKLARRPQCSRMVGQAMFNVPKGLNLPCHRIPYPITKCKIIKFLKEPFPMLFAKIILFQPFAQQIR